MDTFCYFYNYLQQLLLLHLFNGLFSRTTLVSQHQKGNLFWILMKQEMMRWLWHQLDRMQIICTSLHTSTSPLSFYRLDALSAAQPTSSKQLLTKSNKMTCCYFIFERGAKYCSKYCNYERSQRYSCVMCMSVVCLFVCPLAYLKNHTVKLYQMCMLTVAVA